MSIKPIFFNTPMVRAMAADLIEHVCRERDAAIKDIPHDCYYCGNFVPGSKAVCKCGCEITPLTIYPHEKCKWVWRDVCKANEGGRKMARMINADELEKIIEKRIVCTPTNGLHKIVSNGLRTALACVKNAPTIDVEPVRHGRWTFKAYNYFEDEEFCDLVVYVVATCSRCGSSYRNRPVTSETVSPPDDVENWQPDVVSYTKELLRKADEQCRNRMDKYCCHCGARMDAEDTP